MVPVAHNDNESTHLFDGVSPGKILETVCSVVFYLIVLPPLFLLGWWAIDLHSLQVAHPSQHLHNGGIRPEKMLQLGIAAGALLMMVAGSAVWLYLHPSMGHVLVLGFFTLLYFAITFIRWFDL